MLRFTILLALSSVPSESFSLLHPTHHCKLSIQSCPCRCLPPQDVQADVPHPELSTQMFLEQLLACLKHAQLWIYVLISVVSGRRGFKWFNYYISWFHTETCDAELFVSCQPSPLMLKVAGSLEEKSDTQHMVLKSDQQKWPLHVWCWEWNPEPCTLSVNFFLAS